MTAANNVDRARERVREKKTSMEEKASITGAGLSLADGLARISSSLTKVNLLFTIQLGGHCLVQPHNNARFVTLRSSNVEPTKKYCLIRRVNSSTFIHACHRAPNLKLQADTWAPHNRSSFSPSRTEDAIRIFYLDFINFISLTIIYERVWTTI